MTDPLQPSAQLLVKLGSAVVHAAEFMSPGGHAFDKGAFEQQMADPEVVAWIEAMNGMALLPRRRDAK